MILSLLPLFVLTTFASCIPHGPGGPGGPPGGPGHDGHDHNCPTCPTCPAPPAPGCGTCLDTSLHDFAWKLSIEYHAFWYFTTPAHQNSWGTVSFNLTNPAVAATIRCQADSDRLSDFFYGDQWYTCTPSPAVAALPATSFKFFTHSRFELNQTWTCGDKKPVTFLGLAKTDLNLQCTDVSWTNPNYTFGTGEFYSTRDVKCTPATLDLKPYYEGLVL
ncbi:hypothetical protein QBC47DRAFT_383924 [Echria macrotheca]|uniref:AA1-like domain-containing protein n=1 Tax=Echria macrotheca TaxID=438768 RepID=A0AAJ0BAU0_9PEZI|nr:hypothetical protein QBC47DRAFT_383924 [Echria macrotheca]